MKAALEALARRTDFRVAIVSGRALRDLQSLCPAAGCWFVGGHGNEPGAGVEIGSGLERQRRQQARLELERLAPEVRQRLAQWPGSRVEVKPYSLALHYRQAPEWAGAIQEYFSEVTQSPSGASLRVMQGRLVVELLPADALTKGHAVQRLRSRLGCDMAFYFGDDTTDEDVFRLHDEHIVGIKIAHGEGGGPTAAEFALPSPYGVLEALRAIGAAKPAPEKKTLGFLAVQS